MKTRVMALCALIAGVCVFGACQKEAVTPAASDKSNSTPATGSGGTTTSSNDVPETKPAVQTAVYTDVTPNLGGFYQALPARYDSTTKKYPLLVFLHGVGQLGNGTTDLPSLLTNAVPRLLDQKTFPAQFTVDGKNYSFIVLNPQFKAWPQPTDVNAMIDYAIAHYRVDTTRIYVSGLSMGGGATWDYGIAYPKRVAAIVPICGATWPSQAQCGNIAGANLPVWAFHNDDDGTVTANTTRMIVGYINSFNPNPLAQMTIWPYGGHDAWTKATNPDTLACNGKNMYQWMLQYTKK